MCVLAPFGAHLCLNVSAGLLPLLHDTLWVYRGLGMCVLVHFGAPL
jgi:hypothetical protein